MKPSLIAGLTLLAFSTTAGAAEQNVALATAGAVVVADSEYLGSPYVPEGKLARFSLMANGSPHRIRLSRTAGTRP